jgi:hypothetical protein
LSVIHNEPEHVLKRFHWAIAPKLGHYRTSRRLCRARAGDVIGGFRSLEPETRQLYRKHTPPITYIGIDDMRPD